MRSIHMVVNGYEFEVAGKDNVISSIVDAVNRRETRMRTWSGVNLIRGASFGQNVSLTLFPDRVDIIWMEPL